MKIIDIFAVILSVNVFVTTGAPIAEVVFNNTITGLSGTVTLRQNPVLGTYLIGQVRNISCFNSSSATRNRQETALLNNCRLGVTVNNWNRDKNGSFRSKPVQLDRDWRQTIFNLSNIKLPNIQQILSGNYRPIQNLSQTTTLAPDTTNVMGMESGDTCADVGDVYNPRRDLFSGLFGFITPPGVIGNVMVNNGTGSILMGPLELMTAGPTSVVGLPLVLWMDTIRPVVNGTAITLNRGSNDRILDCSIIRATN